MVILLNSGEGLANTATATPANTGGVSGDAFGVVTGSVTGDNTRSAHGNISYKFAPVSGGASSLAFGSGGAPLGGSQFSWRSYFYFTALPTAQFTLIQANDSASATAVRVNLGTDGKLIYATNNSGSTATRWTATNAIPLNQWWRTEGLCTLSSTAGSLQAAHYVFDNSAPVETNTVTGLTFNSGVTLRTVTFGKYGTDTTATPFWGDDFYVNTAATGMPGAFTVPLGQPTVTLSGSATVPSAPGANDATQTVAWGPVSGASSYEAWRATGTATQQSDFTLVATNVTSPYTFTGLGAGTYSYGIKPKA